MVGHSQLLLWSTPTPDAPTRIEVLFKPVRMMNIPTLMNGRVIRRLTQEHASELAESVSELLSDDFCMYTMETEAFTGHVVALTVVTSEDSGDYTQPSRLLVGD